MLLLHWALACCYTLYTVDSLRSSTSTPAIVLQYYIPNIEYMCTIILVTSAKVKTENILKQRGTPL